MLKKWKIVESKYLFKNKHLVLRSDTVELSNKERVTDYTILEVLDGVVVIAITKDCILFTRQYRHGTQEILLQLPGGSYDGKSEDPKEAAARELLEETGYKASNLTDFGEVSIYPSKMTKRVKIYFTEHVEYLNTTKFDKTEDIEIVSIPLSKVVQLIQSGKITDAEAITGIFLLLQNSKMKHKILDPLRSEANKPE